MGSMTRLLGALLLAVAFIAPARADVAWSKVIAAAKVEGKVVVYNAVQGAAYYLSVVKSFEQTYGIKVDTLDLRASEMNERIRTEQATNRFLGDIVQNGQATLERQWHDGPPVEAFDPVPNAKTLRAPFAATSFYVPSWVQAYGFLVNTDLVTPEETPKTWHDLLDPKWRGKILSDDTRPIGGGATMFAVTTMKYGVEFQQKLAAQGLVFSRDLRNDARRIARGEYPIYIPQMFAMASDLKGLPAKVIVPEDGVPYVVIASAMLRNAPHPHAALLFINHMLERQSQIAYANGWMVPVVEGAVEGADPDARAIVGAKLMGATPWQRQQEMIELAKTVYK
jgi:ABC-type Fe3+ transport system substrate-binding protein